MATAHLPCVLLDVAVTPSSLAPLDDLDWSAMLSDLESSDDPHVSLAIEESHISDASNSLCGDACARRRDRRASSARQRRAKSKNVMDALRAEADALREQLAALRRQCGVTNWCERAAAEKRKRTQAESENMQLKRALTTVRTNVQDLDTFLSVGFLNAGVNMRDLLHTYTHLTKDPHSRINDYLAICSQQKLDLAFEIVTREARKLRVTSSSIVVQPVTSRANEFAITVTTHSTLETTDLERAFVVASRAHLACKIGWASFRQVHAAPRAVESPTQAIRYSICEAQYTSESTGEIVSFEECTLTYWKLNQTCGVVVWDFIDVDELHPPRRSIDARRHSTAAMVVHRERCADGLERVVCSTVCTTTFQFSPSAKPIVALDTVGSGAKIVSDLQAAAMIVQQTIFENMLRPLTGNVRD